MTTTMTMTTKTARLHALWARLAALLALLLALGVLAPRAGAQTTSVTFFHNDVLGSPAVATDANGAVVWKESYLPYGHRLQAPAAGANNKLWYAGKQLDPNTGLSYMGARYYSPVVGRFMGMDPKEFSPENPHSLNRYAYGNNNPYKYVDPDGKIAETVWDAFNLSIGFHSLVSNVRAGNWSGAAVDGVGMALDGVAAAVPLMPGGAAAGIAAYRVGNVAAKETKTLFHYTDAAGAKGIAESGVIRPDAKGRVFLTDQRLSMTDVKDRLFIGRSGDKGSHVVEIRVPSDLPIRQGKNPNELIHPGTVRDGRQGTFTVKPNDF
ncbi:MAG: polymorphic toxin type 10 domain-containing protein [Acidovorax sp.]|uniref:RHS repeat-associated core domain-containing protein n=1 Tax=Acidovorax sp. TaxID=1872122 RepID=UPI0022C8DD14|nr:RHS repeat-associated core domain-containing protein [Acidovorax sp.]MCZ8219062.1 polymorphic toxin type 10 domain-containing protein [Acidovorax sp.]